MLLHDCNIVLKFACVSILYLRKFDMECIWIEGEAASFSAVTAISNHQINMYLLNSFQKAHDWKILFIATLYYDLKTVGAKMQ